MSQGKILERMKIVQGAVPIDTTGASQSGDWVHLKKGKRLVVLIATGAWAGGSPAVTLEQAQDNAGTGAKALSFNEYYRNTALTSDTWVKTAVVSDTFTIGTANRLYAIEIMSDQLDTNNDFTHVRCVVASPGANADLIAILYIEEMDFAAKPENLVSIID